MKNLLAIIFTASISLMFCQQTIVSGIVTDKETGKPFPGVRIRYLGSKVATFTDSLGNYRLETYYATDSLVFSAPEYKTLTFAVKKDRPQVFNIVLFESSTDVEVTIRPPEEAYSTIIHKRMVANKKINNREKLESFSYELYNRIQLDVNNIGDKFGSNPIMKRLDVVMQYLDSTEDGTTYLPAVLTESISQYDFQRDPSRKKEVVSASRAAGIDNFSLGQFTGEMYLDINVYDNYIPFFGKSFVSPAANIARSFYKFILIDSGFVDNHFCYEIKFMPKRNGDLTFQGTMWINDTTYAIKKWKADIAPDANINYVQGWYIEQNFDEVQPEVWMQVREKMIIDLKLTEKSNIYGFFGRKVSTRRNFVINERKPNSFYKSDALVQILDSANNRSDEYWASHRHLPLSKQEENIETMIDTLNTMPMFKNLKTATYLLTTGYYPIDKLEIGVVSNFISFNGIEKLRLGLSLRTSNAFSKRIEFTARGAYGFGDKQLKYGGQIRWNVTKEKRGLLTSYYNYDIEQIGAGSSIGTVGSSSNTLLRTGPLDKLTFVEKIGINFERDYRRDLVFFVGAEWKEYEALGVANYVRPSLQGFDTVNKIRSSEITLRVHWGKNEEFISGAFDRRSLGSIKFPIFTFQSTFGIKGLFGSQYEYQKLELNIDHFPTIGVLGRLWYNITAGYIFGKTAYPFLKVHEGSQSYYLYSNSFNKMNFFEFVSDQYVQGTAAIYWNGLLFDRIPLVKKLKWRLVTTSKAAIGRISDRHLSKMVLPTSIKRFNNIPYVEVASGIENIFKVLRIDLVWRLTHLDKDIKPLGIRAKITINF